MRLLVLLLMAIAATPAFAQEREWIFNSGEESAYLVFGIPESDDTGVVFSCPLRSNEIEMFVADGSEKLTPGQKAKFNLLVNGKSLAYEGEVMPNEMSGIPSLRANFSPDDPFFLEALTADRFSLEIMGEGDTFPLSGADVEGLLAACRKGA